MDLNDLVRVSFFKISEIRLGMDDGPYQRALPAGPT